MSAASTKIKKKIVWTATLNAAEVIYQTENRFLYAENLSVTPL